MPLAPVINGIFSSGNISWPNVVGAGPFDGFAVIPNNQTTSQTFTGASVSGIFAGDYAIPAGQFPVTANPGQSIIVHVTYSPSASGLHTALLTVTTNSAYTPTVNLFGTQTTVVTPGIAFPITFFPPTKVGQTTTFANVQIVNIANAQITVSNVVLGTGTDFSLTGVPVVPFTINAGSSSIAFSVLFTPTTTGYRDDTIQVTTSGGGGVTDTTSVAGIGSTLQSAFNMTGGTQGSLFAFPGVGTPAILLAAPGNLNTEEAGSFVKLHDFQIPNKEKQLMRVRGHYEDLGVATVTFTAKARRQGQPDENIQVSVGIGSVAADGWIREFTSEPVPVTGELIQITVSRASNSGPVSLIDYMPEFEPKGEVIGGT